GLLEDESREKITRLRRIEKGLAGLTLFVLLLEALLIFEPLRKRLKKRMADLREARDTAVEALKVRERFLATMSHEVRTPLNGVIGMSDLLLKTELDRDQHSMADTTKRSAEHLLTMLDDVLDYAKLNAKAVQLETRAFDPRQLVADIVMPASAAVNKKAIDLSMHVAENMPELVMGDPTRLRQIIQNLVNNAVKFTEEGTVSVGVGYEGPAEHSELGALVVEVADTGIGIPEDRLESIFEQFQQAESSTTRRYGGSGLGLAIVRELAVLMGGSVSVTSELGEGSTFLVRVPVPRAERAHSLTGSSLPPQDPWAEGEPDGGVPLNGAADAHVKAARVLAVDDHPVNRRLLEAYLERFGCDHDVAESGHAALELFARNDYDVVFLDIQMPGLDGFETAAGIRRLTNGRSVFLAALSEEAAGVGALPPSWGVFDASVGKPFRDAELHRLIVRGMTSSAPAEPPPNSTLPPL
ncbi:MAG: ATP-binding protein, partial [Planctomycetota bacterium]